MKKHLLLLILSGLLTVSCDSEVTEVTQGQEADLSTDTSTDITPSQDAGQKDVTPQKDVTTTDATVDTAADAEIDQNDAGTPIIGSAGCGIGEGIPEGENTFMLENIERNFVMRLPEGYTNEKAWPVVLALHGNGGTSDYWDSESGDRNIRGVLKDDAILIIANAFDNKWRYHTLVNDDDQLETDLLYFEEILSQAKSKMCVNEKAIFSMGFSGGGSYSGVLGCRRTDIRAIAVGGSVIYFKPENCVSTPAAWITIGAGEQAAGRTDYKNYFRDEAGCADTFTGTAPDQNLCESYDGCDEGKPVHYCTHPGGHVWPDFGSQAMWDFFKPFVVE